MRRIRSIQRAVARRVTAGVKRRAVDPEAGSAIIEFLALSFLLLIPVMYLVLTLGRIQAGAFAADSAVRSAARAYVTAESDAEGAQRAQIAAHLAFEDQGITEIDLSQNLRIECSHSPCLTPGGSVEVTVQARIPVPGIPGFIGGDEGIGVNIGASHTMLVDRYAEMAG